MLQRGTAFGSYAGLVLYLQKSLCKASFPLPLFKLCHKITEAALTTTSVPESLALL